MTNVSTGNIDTHPESEKIKLIKAKKKKGQSICESVCQPKYSQLYYAKFLSTWRNIQMKNFVDSRTSFCRNAQKSRFFSIEILCVKSFSVRQYIASKDWLFSLIIMFLGY